MAIDIRAEITCNIAGTPYPIISASVSDDYVQNSGLIKTTGSCEIPEVIVPSIGSIVTFTYTPIGGSPANVPRKLRILSSFADPFRRVTSIELGCLLTYQENIKDVVDWSAFDDPDNSDLTEGVDDRIITIPVRAKYLAKICIDQLQLAGNTALELTNKFAIDKNDFDFSSGYVSVLSDLLVSECRCGYLDFDEILQVFDLKVPSSANTPISGVPVFYNTELIDISSINSGEIPGEAVTVSYSSLKLAVEEIDPDNAFDILRVGPITEQETTPNYYEYTEKLDPITGDGLGFTGVTLVGGQEAPQTFIVYAPGTVTSTTYENYEIRSINKYIEASDGRVLEGVEDVRLKVSSRTDIEESMVLVAGKYLAEMASIGSPIANSRLQSSKETTIDYDDEGRETRRIETTKKDGYILAGSSPSGMIGIDPETGQWTRVRADAGPYTVGVVETTTEYKKGFTEVKTVTKGSSVERIGGQQKIAEARYMLDKATSDSGLDGAPISTVKEVYSQYLSLSQSLAVTSVSTSKGSAEREPTETVTEILNRLAADESGDPNNGYRTESREKLALALGSPLAQRRTEFSMPYAPDDTFTKIGEEPNQTYTAERAGAGANAKRFGRAQNDMLYGNRYGMNIQTSVGSLPDGPFEPFIICADGYCALYRTNGNSWTMDSTGIIVSTDALFWGGVGSY